MGKRLKHEVQTDEGSFPQETELVNVQFNTIHISGFIVHMTKGAIWLVYTSLILAEASFPPRSLRSSQTFPQSLNGSCNWVCLKIRNSQIHQFRN